MTEREHACQLLQQAGFALVDASLFLDTHPQDTAALRYFDRMKQAWQQALDTYERNFGPLYASENNSSAVWYWVSGPWPWEGGN